MINQINFIIIISTLSSFIFTIPTIFFAKKMKLVDDPKKRPHPAHTHKGIIPRAGGICLYLGIFLPIFFLFPLQQVTIGIFIAATLLLIIGLWDDRKDRSPYIRMITNCFAAIIVIAAGVSIPYITNPFGGIIQLDSIRLSIQFFDISIILVAADVLAFLWIFWMTNIIGWSGGVDGQLPGFVAISSFIIGLLSLRFSHLDSQQVFVTYLAFATAGSFIGFLPWNFYPQKIMPGYGGKTLAGFMLAILSILSYSKLGTALLVLAVPITDACFIILKRILSGKSPVWATNEHLHHQLLKIGWGRRKIAVVYWLISAFAGGFALILNSKQKVFAFVLVILIIVGFIVWINQFKKLPKGTPSEEY